MDDRRGSGEDATARERYTTTDPGGTPILPRAGTRPATGRAGTSAAEAARNGQGGNPPATPEEPGSANRPATHDSLPNPALPRGGGALRAIGERFQVNAVTGVAGFSVPLPLPAGRAGFGPDLTLSYSSGGGNSDFGLGWSVGVPSIARRTDRGVPRYCADENALSPDADTFVFSGGEDLIPAPSADAERVLGGRRYQVHRYRPRIEGDFSRVERWREVETGEIHWRVITPDNTVRVFGQDTAHRVADPEDPYRVFQWLLQEMRSDHGDLCRYSYVPEDDRGLPANRLGEAGREMGAKKYLKRVEYGLRATGDPTAGFLFSAIFDYGDHREDNPERDPDQEWPCRQDAFSTHRAGFAQRTRRLCRRVLAFHHLPGTTLGDDPYLVRSLELAHDLRPTGAYLIGMTERGHTRGAAPLALPSLTFSYTSADPNPAVHTVDAPNLPAGLADSRAYRFADLYGDGLGGVLTEEGGGWFFSRNEGDGRFAPAQRLPIRPAASVHSPGVRLMDLGGDGAVCLVILSGSTPGCYAADPEGDWPGSARGTEIRDAPRWRPFRPFDAAPRVDMDGDPAVRVLDLTGDGLADVAHFGEDRLTFYPSRGRAGFDDPELAPLRPADGGQRGPQLLRSGEREAVLLADMDGDGLTDLVHVRNSSVVYWPGQGHGRFGDLVTMESPPVFDHPDHFDARRLRLGDVDGSGTTDLLYLDGPETRYYLNRSGNGFAEGVTLANAPPYDSAATVEVMDLLGTGTGYLVWSSPLPDARGDRDSALRYLDLCGGKKPHLLERVENGIGGVSTVTYAPSTRFYLQDRAEGRPWATRLPFPVQVVARSEVHDHITGATYATRYAYHHGYFDGDEREFRGFGMVEQWDTDTFDPASLADQPPVRTVTWFHTGAWTPHDDLIGRYARDFWQGDPLMFPFPPSPAPAGLTPAGDRAARRALRGKPLRVEIYAEDGRPESVHPFTVTEYGHTTLCLQEARETGVPDGADGEAERFVFFVHEREARAYHYERVPADPRITQTFTLALDTFGAVTEAAVVGLPRRIPAVASQGRAHIAYSVNRWAHRSDTQIHRLSVAVESHSYDVTGVPTPSPGRAYSLSSLRDACRNAGEISFEDDAPLLGTSRRLQRATRHYFWDDALAGPLPLGQTGQHALPHRTLSAAFTPGLVTQVYGPPALRGVDNALLSAVNGGGGYMLEDGLWWAPSGVTAFDPTAFYLPISHTDPFGNTSSVVYDAFSLLPVETRDALPAPRTNVVRVRNHYRILSPWLVTDANGDRAAVRFDALGRVTAAARMGRVGEDLGDFIDTTDDEASPSDDPTARISYHDDEWAIARRPGFTRMEARETHRSDLLPGNVVRWQPTLTYTDGLGGEAQTKFLAEPGDAPAREPVTGRLLPVIAPANPRWIGTGTVVRNNKGNAVRQYEPYFCPDERFDTEPQLTQVGVSATLFYDAPGRVVRVENPNGTLNRTVVSPWQSEAWDENDTARESAWYAVRQALPVGDPERRASDLADDHRETPSRTVLDALGRAVVSIGVSRRAGGAGGTVEHATRSELDPNGNLLTLTDARNVVALTQRFDLLGRKLVVNSADASESLALPDCLGRTLIEWHGAPADLTRSESRHAYDALGRPTTRRVRVGGGTETVAERTIYGEGHPDAGRRIRGHVWRVYDAAGMVETLRVDFKGNILETGRTLFAGWQSEPDWTILNAIAEIPAALDAAGALLLDPTLHFTESVAVDALNRPHRQTAPDGSVTETGYGVSGMLQTLSVTLPGEPAPTLYIRAVDYDAKGQRTRVAYGNNLTTTYRYDPLTYRLVGVVTRRPAGAVAGALPAATIQDLSYTYDAVGNIVALRDAAQQDVFFDNAVASPGAQYEYDALYRLTSATGREHAGANPIRIPDEIPYPLHPLPHPNDAQALRAYTQRYEYDLCGNITAMIHESGGLVRWRRGYLYAVNSNRLLATSAPGDAAGVYSRNQYRHDARGRLDRLPHLPTLDWDDSDCLRHANLGGGGQVYYVYDASGSRVRKVIERIGGVRTERIYLGSYELYREFDVADVLTDRVTTLHVSDGAKRLALIETTLREDGAPPAGGPRVVARYQLDNHLGSAVLETNERGGILSYEEYYPFGQTAYQSGTGAAEVSRKRYRYTGKERDDETGLYYYGARYYLPWLGRWLSPDPLGAVDGTNQFAYVRNNPVMHTDPTGMLTWGQWAGIGAAVVIGTVVTVATAGVAGPVVGTAVAGIIGGIVGGAAGGAVGELVEAKIDKREAHVGRAALIGAAAGGVFAGAGVVAGAAIRSASGQAVATAVGKTAVAQGTKAVATKVAGSAVGQAVKKTASATAGAVAKSAPGKAVAATAKLAAKGLAAVEGASARTGQRIASVIRPGGAAGKGGGTAGQEAASYLSGKKAPSSGESHSADEILDKFRASKHTETSEAVLKGLDSGSIKATFSETLGKGGTASGRGEIAVNSSMNLDDILSTIVHEGKHELDVAASVIPLPEVATNVERGLAEARAFTAAADFAGLNNLTRADAFKHAQALSRGLIGAHGMLEGIIKGYKLGPLTDAQVMKILENIR